MLFDDVWNRPELSGTEVITHRSGFCTGWPNAMSAATIAPEVFDTTGTDAH